MIYHQKFTNKIQKLLDVVQMEIATQRVDAMKKQIQIMFLMQILKKLMKIKNKILN